MSREEMLNRIRAACAAPGIPAHVMSSHDVQAPDAGLPELPAPQEVADPVALFVERARQVGATAEVCGSLDEAAGRAAAWCAQRGRRAAVWGTPDLAPVVERLREAGLEVLLPGSPPEALAQADVGVTGADWGVAETATLVLASAPDRPRSFSLLPPAHLAIVQADRILPDLPALFARYGPLPSALTFITGPSRSADIGLKPVLGAHGPTVLAVLLVAR